MDSTTTISRDRPRPAAVTSRGAGGTGRPRGTGAGTGRVTAVTQLRAAPRQPRPRTAPGPRPRIQRPAAGPARVTARRPARNTAVPRAPFVLLVLALLGGGLICLLVINTTLGATSFEIDRLQHAANARTLQAQQLQQQLATDESDAKIQQEACSLGMRPRQRLEFLDLRTHRLRASDSVAATAAWCKR